MHTFPVLQKSLSDAFAVMDKRRVRALLGAVDALLSGGRLVLMELARHWPGAERVRAPLKRLDRLLSNRHLHKERVCLYAAMSKHLVRCQRPVIIVDWSPLKNGGDFHLLRAALAAGGRTMTLYEAVYEQSVLGNPRIERAFLKQLSKLIPSDCKPIIVTDAGYRTPWFKSVAQLGWDYVGRLRGRTAVKLASTEQWMTIGALFTGASRRGRRYARSNIVRRNSWSCDLVVYQSRRRLPRMRGRDKNYRKYVNNAREPWVLVTSLTKDKARKKQIIELYSRRMQIEESFRDLKSGRYGMAYRYSLTRVAKRIEILLLIHALATFVAWITGLSLSQEKRNDYAGMNTRRTQKHYSLLRMGFNALKRKHYIPLLHLWQTLHHPPRDIVAQMEFRS